MSDNRQVSIYHICLCIIFIIAGFYYRVFDVGMIMGAICVLGIIAGYLWDKEDQEL